MESFWLVRAPSTEFQLNALSETDVAAQNQAETLKYLYLLFSSTDFFPLHEAVFNIEAHIFPRIKQEKFQTGWKRKHHR